jgi:hypothetical protein
MSFQFRVAEDEPTQLPAGSRPALGMQRMCQRFLKHYVYEFYGFNAVSAGHLT